jgi:hypothetical protein
MSGPLPGPGAGRAMSVGNGPPSAGLPPHNGMPQQQNSVPPPAGSSAGPQSQQNLNQIVSEKLLSPSLCWHLSLSLSLSLFHGGWGPGPGRNEHP